MKPNECNIHFDKEKFEFAQLNDKLSDKKFDTKPVSYMKDALRRFSANKSSVVAAIIVGILLLFAIFVPFMSDGTYVKAYAKDQSKGDEAADTDVKFYDLLLPKISFMRGSGIWDGTKKTEMNEIDYVKCRAMELELGVTIIDRVYDTYEIVDPTDKKVSKVYSVRVDSYYWRDKAFLSLQLTSEKYQEMQKWQKDNGKQLFYPIVQTTVSDQRVWYVCKDKRGTPVYNGKGQLQRAYVTSGLADDYTSTRIKGDPGNYKYAKVEVAGTAKNYSVRVDAYTYFQYKYGEEPCFLLGTNKVGYDLLSRLANGARFSFILAICIAVINLTIGAIYGAIEGFYGGVVDLTMERVSDILSGIPMTVVTVLFQLHLAKDVGVIGALVFAFVLTGWIGMASTTRMQFYRYKNQEYILAARTLGASDARLMFKHIFPNALGTLVTSCALVIPGVMLSETSLTYLGIVNLSSGAMSSIGTLLSEGQAAMQQAPHLMFVPAIYFSLLMISFNLFGNGLRDAFNPSLRGSED